MKARSKFYRNGEILGIRGELERDSVPIADGPAMAHYASDAHPIAIATAGWWQAKSADDAGAFPPYDANVAKQT